MHHTHHTRRRHTSAAIGVLVVLGLVAAACGGDDGAAPTTPAPTVTTPTGPDDTSAPDTTTAGSDTTTAGSDTTAPDTTVPGAEPQYGGSLVMALEADTASPWRPSEMVCAISCHMVARSVYDPLMLPGTDDQPHPFLAEGMEPNEDFTQWRITARAGVEFHDGTPFDGAAIVENIERHRRAILTGVVLASLTDVAVDPADPMTAVLTFSAPWAAFPFTVTGQVGYMASPTWLAASDADETLRARPVGTGPFVFAEYRPDEIFRATRNPNYWLDPYPYLDEISFIPVADALTRRDAMRTGSVDMMHTTNGQVISELRANPDQFPFVELTYKGETAYTLLHVTQDGSPLQDQRIRCALANASNDQLIIDTISQGVPPIANGPFSPTQVGWLAETPWPLTQDMATAQALVADYKAENPGAITLALAATNDQTNLTIANFQKQWYEEAGIDSVTIDQIDQANYIVTALLGNFQVFQWRNHGGYDLDSQYVWWHSSSSLPVGALAINFGRIKDDRLDALLDENRGSTDPDRKREIAEEVNVLFAEECYNLWGSWTVWAVAGRPGINGATGTEMVLPDGTNTNPGSGISGTFYLQTVWLS